MWNQGIMIREAENSEERSASCTFLLLYIANVSVFILLIPAGMFCSNFSVKAFSVS